MLLIAIAPISSLNSFPALCEWKIFFFNLLVVMMAVTLDTCNTILNSPQ